MSEEDSARAVRDNALDLKLYAFAKNLSDGHVTEILRRATHPTQPQATRHYPSVEAELTYLARGTGARGGGRIFNKW